MRLPLWSHFLPSGPGSRLQWHLLLSQRVEAPSANDVLALAWTSAQKMIVHISSQLQAQWLHVGSLKLGTVVVLTACNWKTWQIRASFQDPGVEHLSSHHCLVLCLIPGCHLVSCWLLKSSLTSVTNSLHQFPLWVFILPSLKRC